LRKRAAISKSCQTDIFPEMAFFLFFRLIKSLQEKSFLFFHAFVLVAAPARSHDRPCAGVRPCKGGRATALARPPKPCLAVTRGRQGETRKRDGVTKNCVVKHPRRNFLMSELPRKWRERLKKKKPRNHAVFSTGEMPKHTSQDMVSWFLLFRAV